VIVRQSAAGERLSVIRIDNDLIGLAEEIGNAGKCPEVLPEATYGWVRREGACVKWEAPVGGRLMSKV
jgi:hypothetical protein